MSDELYPECPKCGSTNMDFDRHSLSGVMITAEGAVQEQTVKCVFCRKKYLVKIDMVREPQGWTYTMTTTPVSRLKGGK